MPLTIYQSLSSASLCSQPDKVITLGDLKLGLEGVTNFGESPNFLDMACLAKTQKSQFFGHGLFFSWFFLIFEKLPDCLAKMRNSQFFGQKSSPNFRSPSVYDLDAWIHFLLPTYTSWFSTRWAFFNPTILIWLDRAIYWAKNRIE